MLSRLVLIASIVCCGSFAAAADDTVPQPVHEFLTSYCVDCHNQDASEADFAAESLLQAKQMLDQAHRWEQVLEHVSTGYMPPAESDQPTKAERAKITGWIRQRLAEEGHRSEWERKLLYPEYGNLIDHDALFDGSHVAPAYTPSRLWKRSPFQFDSLISRGMDLGRGRYGTPPARLSKTKQPFGIEDKSGIKDFAAILYADSATLGTLMRNAEVIVDQHLSGAMYDLHEKVHGPTPEDQLPKDKNGKPIRPRHHNKNEVFRAIVMSEEVPTKEQVAAAIGKMYELVIEREPSEAEVAKYNGLMRQCIAQGGNAEGLRMTLIAIAVSPPAVYRMELGSGPVDEHGRQLLSPANLAYSISYALTDTKPDEPLLEAARSGKLTTRDDVAREVNRLWDDDEIEKPRILRFFREFFGYHRAPGVFKDDARFDGGSYTRTGVADLLVTDADTLVMHIVREDRNVLSELLTTDKYFVAHAGDDQVEREKVEALWKFHDYYADKDWQNFPYQVPKEHMDFVRPLHRMFTHANGNVTKSWMRYLTHCKEQGIDPIPWNNKRDYIAAYGLSDKTFDYPVEQPFKLPVGERAGILMHPA